MHQWRLSWFSLVLGDTENKNIRGEWIQSWSEIDDLSEPPLFRWLPEDFIPMLVRELAEYPPAELEKDLPEAAEFVSSDLPQKAVLLCPPPGQVRHLQWWIQQYFGDYIDIFWIYTEMYSQEWTEMQLRFQDSRNPSVFITTPKVGGTGLNLTAANHAVITQKFWVLNEQC